MRMRCIGPRSVLAETNFSELTNKTNHIVHSTNAHCTFFINFNQFYPDLGTFPQICFPYPCHTMPVVSWSALTRAALPGA